ncbi:DNA primase [Nitrospirillum bahiense]|uniref:DNA primase n=1 Tax=Nitrospirillum amazonense TaxID=28077 RepID=A0A560F1W2_9PROT|nr:DNA primase [Nitrospirillum amazonense]TWB15612.1 DNA primase catalytic core [Nitrospirillum amazonense]
MADVCLSAALDYAERGWPVFPCAPGGKLPALDNGTAAATTDPERIAALWAEFPGANIGMATGHASGLVALEVLAAGADGGFALPETVRLRGVDGTDQLLFMVGENQDITDKPGRGFAARGEGRFLLLPPSVVDGAASTWGVAGAPSVVDVAPLPDWLVAERRETGPRQVLSPAFLDELRGRLSLSGVVARHVKLSRAGHEFRAPCPFHREKTPSFYVNDEKGFFHCFGCGAHGDAIAFVMRVGNQSFVDAVEMLAAEAGLDVPRASQPDRIKYARKQSLLDLMDRAARWYEGQLSADLGREALAYLQRRGISGDILFQCRIGYAPPDSAPLKTMLMGAGYTEADLEAVGLWKRPDDGRPAYPFFRDRVLFPVMDRQGRVIAFGGRVLDGGSGPKYLNSPDSPLFHKGRLLYGMSRARQAVASGKALIVTEGYLDVISCVMATFTGAVAPLGTALTAQQVEALWRLYPDGGLRQPILCFDGDAAGRKAAHRAVERLLPQLSPDHSARIAFMPDGADPDSLLRGDGGIPAFQAVLDQARSLPDVIWEMEAEGRDLTQADALAGMRAALLQRLSAIPDAGVRKAYEDDLLGRLPRPAAPIPDEVNLARSLWGQAVALDSPRAPDAVGAYVGRFGLAVGKVPPTLRATVAPYRHRLDKGRRVVELGPWPALVAALGTGTVNAVLLTFIQRDGKARQEIWDTAVTGQKLFDRQQIGDAGDSVIRLTALEPGPLTLCVTPELGLYALAQGRPSPVWAVRSVHALGKAVIPETVTHILVCLWEGAAPRKAVDVALRNIATGGRVIRLASIPRPAGVMP